MSTRRDFLKWVATAGVATWAAQAAGATARGASRSANDLIRVAVVGLRGRGQLHLKIGNDQANAFLTRDYRAPFVVPEIG